MSLRNHPLSRRPLAAGVDLSREGRGEETPSREGRGEEKPQYVGGGKTLPRRIPTSPPAGEVDARSAAGEGYAGQKQFVRHLRSAMTEAEIKLWQALRGKRFESYKFRRQVPVGKYIADFVCFERRLIVELDGSQHFESNSDAARDAWLRAQGFRVLRLWNAAISESLDGALLAILDALKEQHHD